jgi:hypothetical protein
VGQDLNEMVVRVHLTGDSRHHHRQHQNLLERP